MMHFIESVTTFSVNTAKAQPIQAAASQFEHTLLDESVLHELISTLKKLVDVCNRSYRGNTLEFHHTPGYVSVRYPSSGSEQKVVTISYAPVLCHIRNCNQIHSEIRRRLEREFPI